MKTQRIVGTVLFAFFVLATGAAIVFAIRSTVAPLVKACITLIPPLMTLAGAIVTNAFQRAREREMELFKAEQLRRQELVRRQQQIYVEILDLLAPYIRDPESSRDKFTTAFLHSWITCSDEVVLQLFAFLKHRDAEHLDSVIRAMRDDIGLGSSWRYREITCAGLFPAPKPRPPGEL